MHILEALSKFDEYFRAETLTNKIKKNMDSFDFEEVVKIDKKDYKIKLKKDVNRRFYGSKRYSKKKLAFFKKHIEAKLKKFNE